MTAATFDTLTAARELAEAGMERRQAEAVAAAIRASQGELATKADLSLLAAEFRADLAKAEARLEAKLTWRIFLIAGAQAGLIVALLKLLP